MLWRIFSEGFILYISYIIFIIVIILFQAWFMRKKQIEKILIACGLRNVFKAYPKIVSKKNTDNGYDVIVKLPYGLSLADFKSYQEAIDQGLDAQVRMRYIGKQQILMQVIKKKQ